MTKKVASNNDKAWYRYQEDVSDVFKNLGCDSRTNFQIEGVRGKHKIDVVARFSHFGFMSLWIVECKYWKTKVSKEKIITFHGIINDIGAEKGFLMSESGFQSGVFKYAEKTNITLCSLEEFREKINYDLNMMTVQRILHQITVTKHKLYNLNYRKEYKLSTTRPSGGLRSVSPPDFYKIFGKISIFEFAAQRALIGKYPVVYGFTKSEKKLIAKSVFELEENLEPLLEESKKYCEKHKDFRKKMEQKEKNK